MSRKQTAKSKRASFSATQRRACIVLILCLLCLIASIAAAWVIMGLDFGSSYDPNQYPVDTTLGAVLTSTDDSDPGYQSSTLFAGDRQVVNLANQGQITIDQYVGADDLAVADIIRKACVYFVDDSEGYTIPQAIAKMKPRRLVMTVGTNDAVAGKSADSFIQDYRQAVKGIATTYTYCDIIVNAVPPVPKTFANAPAVQLLIDQYNQALAKMCDEDGYRFLNSTETLKNATGFGEESYFDATTGTWNKQGISTFLLYLRSHAYKTEDRRPDTNDIPARAAQPSGSGGSTTPTPSPTPAQLTATYGVEAGKGTLTGNGQSGVTTIEAKVAPKTTVSVTAVAADGFAFYKWSDGQTSETRYDIVTQDLSVTAMFNDARVSLTLDQGDKALNVGESLTINSTVMLADKKYDNTNVQWSVNDEMEANGGSYTFQAKSSGTYTIKAGIEINGNYQSAALTITVNAPATAVTASYPTQPVQAGVQVALTATVENGVGETAWSCDQMPDWNPTGSTVTFTLPMVYDTTITYYLHATNNNVRTDFTITSYGLPSAAATPAPPTDGTVTG